MNKRYIDADKYKQDLIQLGFLPALVVRVLDKQPTADVVEVVRCRDCKYCYYYDVPKLYECEYHGSSDDAVEYVQPTHYCSYGERREENEG